VGVAPWGQKGVQEGIGIGLSPVTG
jgi:hypothetical protein